MQITAEAAAAGAGCDGGVSADGAVDAAIGAVGAWAGDEGAVRGVARLRLVVLAHDVWQVCLIAGAVCGRRE